MLMTVLFLFQGGGFYLLGVQALAVVSLTGWTLVTSYVILKLIDVTIGLRIPLHEELLGADIVEHGIGDGVYDRATGRLIKRNEEGDEEDVPVNRLTSSRRRRLSLGKRQSRKRRQFSTDEEDVEDGDFSDVRREDGRSGSPLPPYSPNKTRHSVSCCDCFFSHLGRRGRLSLPPKDISTNATKRSRHSEQCSDDISAIHSPSTMKELKRTEYLQIKYGISKVSTNGRVSNGYANVGYGFSRDVSTDFQMQTELPSNGSEQVTRPNGSNSTPDFEMTYI